MAANVSGYPKFADGTHFCEAKIVTEANFPQGNPSPFSELVSVKNGEGEADLAGVSGRPTY